MAKRKPVAQRRAEEAERRQQMLQRTSDRFAALQAQLEDLGRLIERYNRDRRSH
jgi:hypothetical protein